LQVEGPPGPEPGERIAVLGSEPQIYFYAKRRSATGYIYTYPLMEPQPYSKQMATEFKQEVEGAKAASRSRPRRHDG